MMAMVRVRLLVNAVLLASVIILIGGGCAGFSAAPAISPLMFLLQTKPGPQKAPPPEQVAYNGDASRIN
jgi:hypothetical protein